METCQSAHDGQQLLYNRGKSFGDNRFKDFLKISIKPLVGHLQYFVYGNSIYGGCGLEPSVTFGVGWVGGYSEVSKAFKVFKEFQRVQIPQKSLGLIPSVEWRPHIYESAR